MAPVTRGIPDSPPGCNVGSSRAGTGARPVTGPLPAASGSIRQHDRIGSGRVRKIAPVWFGPGETSARDSRPSRTGRSREASTRSGHTLAGGRPGWSRQTGLFAGFRRPPGPGVPRMTRCCQRPGPSIGRACCSQARPVLNSDAHSVVRSAPRVRARAGAGSTVRAMSAQFSRYRARTGAAWTSRDCQRPILCAAFPGSGYPAGATVSLLPRAENISAEGETSQASHHRAGWSHRGWWS